MIRQACSLLFFDIKGIVHKQFVLAGQTVNSAYYCDVLRLLGENVRRLRPELWRQKNWLLHHDNAPSHTPFFTRELFYPKQHDCLPESPYFSVYPIDDKTETPHFDTIVVIEAESQAMLNTLKEHDFQDVFKKWQKRCKREGEEHQSRKLWTALFDFFYIWRPKPWLMLLKFKITKTLFG
jgi:hypothetical protein